jgi:hypothetical protein
LFQSLWGLGLEGSLASETLEHDGAEGPEVGLGVILQRHDDLWGHIHGAAAQSGRHHTVLQEPSKAKICNLQHDVGGVWIASLSTVRQQNVLGLQISVDNSLAVHGNHGSG